MNLKKIKRVRERGEADYLPEDDGPLSCCDEFLTPVHHHITTAPIIKTYERRIL